MLNRQQLQNFYQELLFVERYSDYCPNGLQIEGCDSIKKIAFAVSATQDSITQAIENNADTLVVHHGLFWHFHGAKTLTGAFGRRVLPLVKKNMNLFAYHLPLDGHIEIGNASSLARLINCIELQAFGDYKGCTTGIKGVLENPVSVFEFSKRLESVLNHPVIIASSDKNQSIQSVGIITGGANGEWKQAVAEGLDAYITGEISEHDWHEAQEAGVNMFAGGHYATEQFGIQALMKHTQQQFGAECFFIASENPA